MNVRQREALEPRPDPPGAVRWITETLEAAGFETWAVGGAVRDTLMGLPPGDWDLATRARPADVRRLFRRTVPIGVEHGTVGVLAGDGTLYELTTFRRDVETDGRHAVVAFADTLDEDLSRRDFTINAVAWHPLREEFHDPHGGREDIRRGVLRTVEEPERRFREDYLRILRGLRFAGRFGLDVDPATWEAMLEHRAGLAGLSAERVREELFKVLGDARASHALRLYGE
ncbi:MAG: CCA tRNA nucleotidyltransferase, partial [Gemmatimonadetes bacterium]